MFYGMNAWFLASLAMGAGWWAAFVSLPSWRALAPAAAVRAQAVAWRRGGPALTALSLTAAGLGAAAAFEDADVKWAIGAGLTVASAVFALVFLSPLNARMRALMHALAAREGAALTEESREIDGVLKSWGRLHQIRCGLLTIGVFFFIWAAH